MSHQSGQSTVAPLAAVHYEELVRRELTVDLGSAGDVTTDAIVADDLEARAQIVARQDGRVCGLACALFAFETLGPVRYRMKQVDGNDVAPGTVLVDLEAPARVLLSAERTALNFLAHLSGIATVTRDLVHTVSRVSSTRVACTRKTTPGLRAVEKYAVRVGGASNHRFGLHDAILIKDNHRFIAGGVGAAIARARALQRHLVRLEVEVDSLDELQEALDAGADVVLLDNMSIPDLKRAVVMACDRAVTEASGGITADTIAEVAATGVDVISVGWITHSAPALDVGLDIVVPSRIR